MQMNKWKTHNTWFGNNKYHCLHTYRKKLSIFSSYSSIRLTITQLYLSKTHQQLKACYSFSPEAGTAVKSGTPIITVGNKITKFRWMDTALILSRLNGAISHISRKTSGALHYRRMQPSVAVMTTYRAAIQKKVPPWERAFSCIIIYDYFICFRS